jgi:outer membrane murein-binding lipoprotein Lpp
LSKEGHIDMADMDIKRSSQSLRADTAQSDSPAPKKPKRLFGRFNRLTVFSATIVVLLVAGGFVTYKYAQAERQINQLRTNPQQAAATSAQKLIVKVGQLVQLPANQAPTVALVKNASKLQGQPFFAAAQNGDYVLVYAQAKKAVLYRPSINRVIEYANTN